MEGGTGVYYQAMPAVGPDGKNVMKLIPVQKVNGQFFQTPFNTERDNMDLQLKAFAKPVHTPAASSSQTQTRLPSLQPTADGRVVLKTLPEFKTLSNAIKTQPSGTNSFTIQNPKQVHVPLVTHSVPQYTVQLPPQPSGQGMAAVQTLPVTVKSPVLPNGHFLQIPPNAKVRTLPATALPQSIKCRIMNSMNNTPNLGKGPPTVVFVSPVNSVKLNTDQQMLLLTKPSQIQKTLSQNPPANLQTPVCIPKTNEEASTPIKWVVQEGTGASAPCLVPLSTPNMSSDSLKAVKHVNSVGTANEIPASIDTPPQTSQEKITPGKDNALVMCNGKVYFVAKKNSEIAKDVIGEGGKKLFVSTSPALPASSALGTNSSKRDPPKNVSEIIDLCDDDEETSTCLGGAPGNLPTRNQTEVDESDEDSNVIFVSYIPPKSGEKVAKSASQNQCEEVIHIEINTKSVSLNEGGETAHAEMEKDGVSDNPLAKTSDGKVNVDEEVKEKQIAESNLIWVSDNVTMEADLASKSPTETRDQADGAVTETVSVLEQTQNICDLTTDNTEKVIGTPALEQTHQPKSDCQLRKDFGITSDVQIRLQKTKLPIKPDKQTERLIINKRTLDGLRKVIQDSKLQSKIQHMMHVPSTKTEEDEGLKVKRKKLEHDESQDSSARSITNFSPVSKCSVVPIQNSLVLQICQKEVCLPTKSAADKDHMQSEMPADSTGDTSITSSPEQPTSQTASHPFLHTSARKMPPRSKKGKVCTACPCGTVLGVAEATSSLHPQEKPNPCTVGESQKGTRKSCLNKSPVESCQPKDQDPVKKAMKKRLSRSPRKDTAPLESPTSESSHNVSSPNSSLSDSFSSSLQDSNKQIALSSNGIKCGNLSSSHTDAETSQQDTSQVQTASDNPIVPFSKKHPEPEIDNFPTQTLYSLETLDAEEIKRQERIKRLKDLLKEKEAALERMQQSMNV
ncbi:ligand-dependent nuclear receptor-interacting factor 1 [Pseudorasbora parva]|uniref:ligand-dependent nuclear receptor-interacting factor 1 n=1 Tax=Pseudorasbora parva TaxID=51549 RepID=UPI00351F162D